MAYIGKTPITGNFVKLDAISVVNGQAGYTMNNGGSAFTDYENVNQFLVSLNGILQAPTDSFTVSGSTLTFASNLATGDVIDFVIVLGNTLDIGTPSDATVTQAKTNFVSTSSSAGLQIKGDNTTAGTLQLNCEQNSHGIKLKSPPHSASASYTLTFPNNDGNANEFLKTDGSGVMSWAEAGGGKLLQSVLTTSSTQQTISSSSFTDLTGMTVNITPVSSTSKFLITAYSNIALLTTSGGSTDIGFRQKILRDSTAITTINSAYGSVYYHQGSSNLHLWDIIMGEDDHNTSSQVTIKVQGAEPEGNTAKLNLNAGGNTKNSYLLVQEIET